MVQSQLRKYTRPNFVSSRSYRRRVNSVLQYFSLPFLTWSEFFPGVITRKRSPKHRQHARVPKTRASRVRRPEVRGSSRAIGRYRAHVKAGGRHQGTCLLFRGSNFAAVWCARGSLLPMYTAVWGQEGQSGHARTWVAIFEIKKKKSEKKRRLDDT